MPHRKIFISVTLSVLLFPFSALSQEPGPLRGLDESAATAVRKKAIDLLESVASQIDGLRSAENRARIGSNLGELLWTHDEKRSRTLFAAVREDIKAGFNEADTKDVTSDQTLMVFWQLRSDTLGRIAKHDPVLALEFLRATRPPADVKLPYQMRDGEKSLELRLASQIAAKNPGLALKLGRQSLAKGFSPDLLSVLSQLRKNKDAAQSFFKEIVDKLKSVDLAQDSTATEIALSLARSFPPPAADELAYRDLIGVLLASALASGCANAKNDGTFDAPQICFYIGSVFSRIEKYYAQDAASLRQWAGGEQAEDEWTSIRGELEKGTVDEILALAGKYPEMQRQLYWEAMRKTEASGDYARARQIASAYPEEGGRFDLLAEVDRAQMWKSLNSEKLAAIQQELSELSNNEERIGFLFSVAMQVGGTERKAALALLSQAGQLIDSTKPGRAQLEGQIALAMMYCSLKSDRGFTIMESLIPRFNELVTASATLDGFSHNYLRDGEWNMSGEGEVGRLLNAVAENAGFFAALDFDRSVNLAGQMERPELRLMAKLKIAQGVLASPPNPALMFQPPGFIR